MPIFEKTVIKYRLRKKIFNFRKAGWVNSCREFTFGNILE
jgi:hypothetical protein